MITINRSEADEGILADLMPDLTPMLDILFILLVFFMLTAGVVFQSLNVDLPENVDEQIALLEEPRQILVEIRKDDFSVNGEVAGNFATLKDMIKAAVQGNPEQELVIAGDRHVVIGRLLRVLTYLQTQGITAANILMQGEQE